MSGASSAAAAAPKGSKDAGKVDVSAFENAFSWTKESSLFDAPREVAARLAKDIQRNRTMGNSRDGGVASESVVANASSSSASSSGAGKSSPFLLVHRRQRGNPLLKHVRAVKWNYQTNIFADYIVGGSVGVVFLSVKYHLLHRNYVRRRLAEVRGRYRLAILLLYVDEDRPNEMIEELTCIATSENVTIVCCWSSAEAARYLETFKLYEKKSASVIQAKEDESYSSQLSEFLTSIRGVNKRDVLTLISNFGSLAAIMQADMASLALCPGLGPRKCQNIWECFHGPLGASAGGFKSRSQSDGTGDAAKSGVSQKEMAAKTAKGKTAHNARKKPKRGDNSEGN